MFRRFKSFGYAISAALLLIGMVVAGTSFAKGLTTGGATTSPVKLNPGTMTTHTASYAHTVDPSKISGGFKAATGSVKVAPTLPVTTKARLAAAAKASKVSRANAPIANATLSGGTSSTSVNTPFQTKNFAGLSNTCNPGLNNNFVFQPSDLAVAASSSWVVEAVNNCIAVYTTSGTLQTGWPKSPDTFFGVPNLGACQALGSGFPFMSDPRAAYDPNTGKFYLQWLEAEGVFGIDSCAPHSFVWQAVSNSSDPRSSWTVHGYNVSDNFNGTATAGDYDTLGFDSQGLYFAVNEFDAATGTSFLGSDYCGVPKANLGILACGHNPTVTGSRTISVDTMQPVMTETRSYGPRAEYIVNTYNIEGDPFSSDCFSSSCTGLVVWAFTNLANWAAGGSSPHVSGTVLGNTKTYIGPPAANDPACSSCVETLDTRISGTPVYSAGEIWAAWATGIVNFQSTLVAGVLWTQSRAELTDNNSGICPGANDICPDVSTSYQLMGYYFFEPNDQSAYFPALMTDSESNLFMT
ncbi:MAG TPA: hypothetical protein VFN02_16500, partial [Ktedonobacteraceae bacterium]|nr:hypothetical protein [Ktedonobacteraceae bacterium]